MSYPYRSPADETRITASGIVVTRTRILSTQFVIYTAYESSSAMGRHATITTIAGQWYGTLASRRDDSSYAQLRGGSPERVAAVRAQYAANHAASYAAILAVFPEASNGARSDGSIEFHY